MLNRKETNVSLLSLTRWKVNKHVSRNHKQQEQNHNAHRMANQTTMLESLPAPVIF
jgi:hypothetical protein